MMVVRRKCGRRSHSCIIYTDGLVFDLKESLRV
jgi:hypothetical protein